MFCGRPLCSRQVSLQCHQSSSSSPFLWLPSKSFSHRRGETKNGENLMIIVLIIVIIVFRQLTWQTLGATGNSPHPNNKTRELTDGRPSCLAENSSWQHLTCVSQVLLPLLSYWLENILAKESGKNGKKSSGTGRDDIFRNWNMSTLGDNVKSISKSICGEPGWDRGGAEWQATFPCFCPTQDGKPGVIPDEINLMSDKAECKQTFK